ncbi:MAG TPA: hypothetical protein DD416_02175 [Rhodobacteraceae bacterium]|nr:hypothetical protein [Paracoccaceae bacterium]
MGTVSPNAKYTSGRNALTDGDPYEWDRKHLALPWIEGRLSGFWGWRQEKCKRRSSDGLPWP